MTRSNSKVRERILAVERILTDKAKNAKEILDELQKSMIFPATERAYIRT